ncbi:WXG100-like domain-containing protein [Saccharopolyspora tripterygii]
MAENDLVVTEDTLQKDPNEAPDAIKGVGLAESGYDLYSGISEGNWVSAGLGAAGLAMEAVSMAVDPIGTLISYGLSWLMEHVEPLKEALDWFAGDPDGVKAYGQTWGKVSESVKAAVEEFNNAVKSGTAEWTGQAGDAYRKHAAEKADAIAAAGEMASTMSSVVTIMGEVVSFVREFVRDLVSETISAIITYALEAVCSFGLATPVIVGQVAAKVAKVTKLIGDKVTALIDTIKRVTPMIGKAIEIIGKILKKLMGGGGALPEKVWKKVDDTFGTNVVGKHNAKYGGGPDGGGSSGASGPDGDSGPGSSSSSSGSGSDTGNGSSSGNGSGSENGGSSPDSSNGSDSGPSTGDRSGSSTSSSSSGNGSGSGNTGSSGSSPDSGGSPSSGADGGSATGSSSSTSDGTSSSASTDSGGSSSPSSGSTSAPEGSSSHGGSSSEDPGSSSPSGGSSADANPGGGAPSSSSSGSGPDSPGNGPSPSSSNTTMSGDLGSSPHGSSSPDSGDSPGGSSSSSSGSGTDTGPSGGSGTSGGSPSGGGTPSGGMHSPSTPSAPASTTASNVDAPAAPASQSPTSPPPGTAQPNQPGGSAPPAGGAMGGTGGSPGGAGPSGGSPSGAGRPTGSGWTGTPGNPGAAGRPPSTPDGPPRPRDASSTGPSAPPRGGPDAPSRPGSPGPSQPGGPSGPPKSPDGGGPGTSKPPETSKVPESQKSPDAGADPGSRKPDTDSPEEPKNGPESQSEPDAPDKTRDHDSHAPDGDEPEPGTPEYEQKIDDGVSNSHDTDAGMSGHDDPNMQDLADRVPHDGKHFTVDAHHGPDGMRIGDRNYSPDELADVLRRSGWDGESPIRLLSCDSSDFARDLARNLDVDVTAPNGRAWSDGNGNVFSTSTSPDGGPTWPPDGGWDTHHPDGTHSPAGEDGFHPSKDGEDPGQRPEDAADRGQNEPPRDADGRVDFNGRGSVRVRQDDGTYDLYLNGERYPESARHIFDAQGEGHPSELSVDQSADKKEHQNTRRDESLDEFERQVAAGEIPDARAGNPDHGLDRDEYPPARMYEGGNRGTDDAPEYASVRLITGTDNQASGSSWWNHGVKGLPDGTQVNVIVEKPPDADTNPDWGLPDHLRTGGSTNPSAP